jgi:hypothetical protein
MAVNSVAGVQQHKQMSCPGSQQFHQSSLHPLLQYTGFIYGYMCFAGFSIFFVLAGVNHQMTLSALPTC